MHSVNHDFLARWHPIVGGRDLAELENLLAPDVTMGAPPYWDKLAGRALVHHLLGLIIHTIDDFTYIEESTYGHVGKPFLVYSQKTRGADGVPMHAEVGYLRPVGTTGVELVLAPQVRSR